MANANVVQVEVRSVYGALKIYPLCERGKLLAELAGSRQLTPQAIALIRRMGFQVEEVAAPQLAGALG